ncbi:MAG: alkylation response protein AidB-like acyl-CoA dehydrogenase [Alphaproteobacteria bacterium]|jgi:alkylation response protein AidB-like acyl-CoA dehydrogenase
MALEENVTDVECAPSREDFLARAREIAPRLRERALQADAERCTPAATVDDYRQTGLIRMIQPKRFGGQEVGWDLLCEVTEILAAACGSQAWIQRICCAHAQILATFPPEAQDDVWTNNHDVLISASFDPLGKGRPVDGGYIFSGRHGFSSGIDHCDWHICGGFIIDGDKRDGPYFFLVPRADIEIIDDWHTIGLRGTGSKSFEVKDAFVPAHRILNVGQARDGHGPGTVINTAPVYRTPRGGITTTGFAALTVGIAKGVLEDWYDYTRPRKSRGVSIGAKESVQVLAAHCSAEIEAASLLYNSSVTNAQRKLEAGESFSELELATARRNVGMACKLALKAGTRLFNAAGGRAMFEGHSLERQYRNLIGAASHHGVNWETLAASYGKEILKE